MRVLGHCTPRDTRGRYRKSFRTRACTARIERGLNPLALSSRVSGTRGARRFYDERLRGAFASQLFSRSVGRASATRRTRKDRASQG